MTGSADGPPGPSDGPCSPERLARLVAAHPPADERERASRDRFLAELGRLPDPCSQDAGPVHVTASGIVVGSRGTLLHRHRRLGRWMQPGGHIETGEAPAAAARRESEEETGLPMAHPRGGPQLVHLDVHRAPGGHMHLDLRFLLVAPDSDPSPPPDESPDVRWYSWDEAAGVADDSLTEGLAVARRLWEQRNATGPATAAAREGNDAVDRR